MSFFLLLYFLGVNSKLLGLGATIGQQLPNLRLKLLKQRTYNWRGITKKKGCIPLGISLFLCGPAWA